MTGLEKLREKVEAEYKSISRNDRDGDSYLRGKQDAFDNVLFFIDKFDNVLSFIKKEEQSQKPVADKGLIGELKEVLSLYVLATNDRVQTLRITLLKILSKYHLQESLLDLAKRKGYEIQGLEISNCYLWKHFFEEQEAREYLNGLPDCNNNEVNPRDECVQKGIEEMMCPEDTDGLPDRKITDTPEE